MNKKKSKSNSRLCHVFIANASVIPTIQLAQIKGGFVISDEITGL